MSEILTIRRPDDWHLHLRDGAMLSAVLPFTARTFGRAIVMPNLVPPVLKTVDAVAYRERILSALPEGSDFVPLMTAYLTDGTDSADLASGFEQGVLTAAKLYPAGATTNSDSGVTDIQNIDGVLKTMTEIGMPLLVHGEVTDADVDIFDREKVFIERILAPTLERLPDLKVVFEHVTTAEGVAFVRGAGGNVGATITPHHLVINRNAMFAGGMRPHMYCLPVAKRECHRLALREAATSGDPSYFLGTDSAPHPVSLKETDCGCAGVFNAPSAMEVYTQVFEEENALDRLEAFAALNGPTFYGLPLNEGKITLTRGERNPDPRFTVEDEEILPFFTDAGVNWIIADI
jgi:dihydroorotase